MVALLVHALALPALVMAKAPPLPENIAERQLQAGGQQDDGSDWLLYGRNYKAWRFSPLTQVTPENVSRLRIAWQLPTGLHDAFEASPIVVDGTMYFTTPWNHVYAVDAATGEVYWHYVQQLAEDIPLCCGAVNRGAAVGGGKVVFASLDARLVALDAVSGEKVWESVMADIEKGYSATIAPQIAAGKVILGVSGGVFGIRGFIDAYDLETGERAWRFWTIPAPGEPGSETWEGDSWKTGGGPAWMTPTYDPDTHTFFVGTGNPSPVVKGSGRKGDNLFTECIVALDADTGKLKWYYQVIPHDVWDLDNSIEPIIDDITVDGEEVQAVMFASKNGYFYVLDRTDGRFIYAIPFAHKITWGKVEVDGSVVTDSSRFPRKDEWTVVYPGAAGGKEWCPVAYDPRMKRMFVPSIENGHRHKVIEQEYRPGLLYWSGISEPVPNEAYGHIAAIDVEKKKIAWDIPTKFPVVSGISATASGLVITGTPDQTALFLDARDGKVLHQIQAPSGWHSAPVVYSVDNRQYIAFANGWGGWVAGFDLMGTPELEGLPRDNVMFSYALPEDEQ